MAADWWSCTVQRTRGRKMLPLFPHPPPLAIALALCTLSGAIGASCLACALVVTARVRQKHGAKLSRGERMARHIANAERQHREAVAIVECCVQKKVNYDAAHGERPSMGRRASVIYVHRGLPSSGVLWPQLAKNRRSSASLSGGSSSSSSSSNERARLVGGNSGGDPVGDAQDVLRSPLSTYGSIASPSMEPSVEPKRCEALPPRKILLSPTDARTDAATDAAAHEAHLT